MNIHHYAGQHIDTNEARRRGFSVGSSKGTESPRTRDNLRTGASHKHNGFPGGKTLRRAQAKLATRINGIQNGRRPDRISSRDDGTPWGSCGFTKPGSMKA